HCPIARSRDFLPYVHNPVRPFNHVDPFPTRRSSALASKARAPPGAHERAARHRDGAARGPTGDSPGPRRELRDPAAADRAHGRRSEEHTSELQSRENLVCRLLREKKNAVWYVLAKCF